MSRRNARAARGGRAMHRRGFLAALALAASLGLAAAGPALAEDPSRPPPDGTRVTHGGATLVYDAALRVYLVAGQPYTYFAHGLFVRAGTSGWRIARALEGPWFDAKPRQVPQSLVTAGGSPPGPGRADWPAE